MGRAVLAASMALVAGLTATLAAGQPASPSAAVRVAEQRATAYLAIEVPRWRREHPCYSCHNNGDAARALVAASARGFPVGDAVADTLAWLAQPEKWDANESRGGSEDLPLARIQFASALEAVAAVGRVAATARDQAAERVVAHQRPDGSWRLSESQTIGGPTFYGTALATAMARRSLSGASAALAAQPIARAGAWLRNLQAVTVLDASSVLLGLGRDADPAAVAQRARCLDILKRGQGPDGGWGPYVVSPSEPFDSALAVLALAGTMSPDLAASIQRGRDYLAGMQNPDGSWFETTRPAGGESYAQRISTTAWALLALLASD